MSLTQGRYTWRHNGVLNHLATVSIQSKPDNCEILADLPGMDQNGSTIPPDILLPTSRPDLVILNREDKKIFLLELTCSFESNVDSANITKTLKYTQIKQDIEDKGYTCILLPFEIGSRGYVSKRNKVALMTVFTATKMKTNAAKCITQLSKISLASSFSIFHAFTQPSWRDPPLLKP